MPQTFQELAFSPSVNELLEATPPGSITILTGGNNSGKSAYLKKSIENKSNLYIGVNRFYSFHHLPPHTDNTSEIDQFFNSQISISFQQWNNYEGSFFNTQTALTRLNNNRRAVLFEVFHDLFGVSATVQPENPDNEFSNRYVAIGGESLSVTSSGTRLFLGLLAAMMDDRFTSFAIDEPELGLSPSLQRKLAGIMIRGDYWESLFPHRPRLMISTHSHLFLDRLTPSNNCVVTKEGNLIRATRCASLTELHEVQFRLLGNELGELLLPDAVFFVEGVTDKAYLDALLAMEFPLSRIVVEACGGDIAERLNYWGSSLGDMQASPYRNRTFVVFDKVKQAGLERTCDRLGIPNAHRVEWEGNGIEYVYPLSILTKIFRRNIEKYDDITIKDDFVSCGELSYKKGDLNKMVLAQLNSAALAPLELRTKLIEPVRAALG